MRILAADTSTASGSLALLDGENLTAEWTLRSAQTHNRRLLKSIDSLLREAGWDLETIDAFAVACGPGSFTGLRIGMTTMKVLAWTRASSMRTFALLTRWPYRSHFRPIRYAPFSTPERAKSIAHSTGLTEKAALILKLLMQR